MKNSKDIEIKVSIKLIIKTLLFDKDDIDNTKIDTYIAYLLEYLLFIIKTRVKRRKKLLYSIN